MAYPSLAPSRRSYDSRRRRRRLILFMILALAVALIALAVRYRTDERRASDYMAQATQIAQNEAGLAASLTAMLTALGGLERQDLLNQIDSLGSQVAGDVQLLAAQEVPASVAEANGYLTVALGAWRDAMTSLDDAVLLILDSVDEDPVGESALTGVFDLLRVGDLAYQGFLDARSRIEGDVAAGSIPDVDYVGPGVANLYDGVVIATRLRATRQLGGRHDISITARTVPEPLGTSNGRPVVPASDTFEVLVVVTNEGNLIEESIRVALELGLSSGDDAPTLREQLILSLDAGEARTVEFADLDLVPGELYNLQITASITQDADPLNNVFELVFFRNQDA